MVGVDTDGLEALQALSRRLDHAATIARLCADGAGTANVAASALNGMADLIEQHVETLDAIVRSQPGRRA